MSKYVAMKKVHDITYAGHIERFSRQFRLLVQDLVGRDLPPEGSAGQRKPEGGVPSTRPDLNIAPSGAAAASNAMNLPTSGEI